jgi:hypothetical protein
MGNLISSLWNAAFVGRIVSLYELAPSCINTAHQHFKMYINECFTRMAQSKGFWQSSE